VTPGLKVAAQLERTGIVDETVLVLAGRHSRTRVDGQQRLGSGATGRRSSRSPRAQ
jgi:hypothetical protein